MAKEKPKRKGKKKEAFEGRRGGSGETLPDFVAGFLANGPKRFRDIVEHVRGKREKAGYGISDTFDGQVWHATKRVASPVDGQRGFWKLDKAKWSGNPAKKMKPKPIPKPKKAKAKAQEKKEEDGGEESGKETGDADEEVGGDDSENDGTEDQ